MERTRDALLLFFFSGDKSTRVMNRQNAFGKFPRERGHPENERRRDADGDFGWMDGWMDGCAAHVDARANERTNKEVKVLRATR